MKVTGVRLPTVGLKDACDFIRDNEPKFLFNHSMRVFVFGSLQVLARNLQYDVELLLVAGLFHDLGLVEAFSSPNERFELDGANAVRAFFKAHDLLPEFTRIAWEAIAVHTTQPSICARRFY